MNYLKIYDSLINRARVRNLAKNNPEGVFIETHHIVPISMGGSNDQSNLVPLTGREHFIAHWLLYKIHKNRAMAFAWNRMCDCSTGKRYTSRSFQYARSTFSKNISGINHPSYGCTRSDETKKLQSESKKRYLEKNPEALHWLRTNCIGYTHTDIARLKISEAGTGRLHSVESKEKIKDGVRKAIGVSVISTDSRNVDITYDFMQDAVDEGFTASNIVKCCKGERKLHKGFKWRYAK